MANEFQGRRVVITGGTGFLGSAVVKAFLDAGASCDVTWESEDSLRRFPYRERVSLHQVNCADEQAVTRFYEKLNGLWTSIHLVGGFAMAPIEKTSAADFRRMFEVNALTCFLCCREAINAIRRSQTTTSTGGRIVNVAARPALVPASGMIAYSTSKSAVASITRSLAEELKAESILVNAIAPSIMDTPANRRDIPTADFTQWPKVEEVAQTIAFLASPTNALTSGEVLPVYGKA